MKNIKECVRDSAGKFSAQIPKPKNWGDKFVIGVMVVSSIVLGGGLLTNNYEFLNTWATREHVLSYVAPEIVFAAEVKGEGLTVEQLEAKLDAIVWHGESKGLVMEEGDIFPVFDPSQSMYQKCIKIGGKQHKDCLSYGPRQEKIGTIQHYYKKLYDKEVSDREARDIAEGNESSRRFFLDCAVKVKGCANNWTAFNNHKTEGQLYIDLIREAKGIKID